MADSPIIKPGQGLGEAPEDGNTYAREDGEWVLVKQGLGEAPIDGQYYSRQDASWQIPPGSDLPAAPPEDGNKYVLEDGAWVLLTHDGGVYTGTGVPQGGILNPSGDSVIPATFALIGVWSPGDTVVIDVNVDTLPNTVSLIVSTEQNALEVAAALAVNISLLANIEATENDGVVFVLTTGAATTVSLANLMVTPGFASTTESVPYSGDMIQQARTHLSGVEPSPNSMQPGQLIANPTDAKLWVGDYIGNPIPVGGDFPEAPIDGTPYSRQDEGWVPASAGGDGEANTASSPSTVGEELTMPKSGIDLQFKKIIAGTGITLTPSGMTLTIDSAGGSTPDSPSIEVPVTKPAHGFVVTQCVRWNGTAWVLALLDVATNVSHGVVTEVVDTDNFKVAMVGRYEIPGHGLPLNEWLYVSDTIPGALASVPPDLEQPIVFVESLSHIWVYPYRPNNTGGAAIAGMQIELARLANRVRNLESN